MLADLSKDATGYAAALVNALAARRARLDPTQLDEIVTAANFAFRTVAYATKARSVLVQPLRDRNIDVDGNDWRGNVIKLYALWQKMRPAEVEKRMAELAEANKDSWRKAFPDEWDVDEARLLAAYKAGEALQINGAHAWPETSTAIRFYAAEQIAPLVGDRGFFDWGGSDGLSCMFACHHGARDVHLHEPNANNRAFCNWLSGQLAMKIETHEEAPPPPERGGRQFGAGFCTEVLEHVVDPQGMMRRFHDLLVPGGVMFVTSSFGVPQDSHLAQNRKFSGKEKDMMREAGLIEWNPPVPPPMPMLPQWGFWQRPR